MLLLMEANVRKIIIQTSSLAMTNVRFFKYLIWFSLSSNTTLFYQHVLNHIKPFQSISTDADPSPSKYCDKMMNSIWGLYNRYSVHNFKSNTSSGQAQTATLQQPATKESQDWLQNPIKCPLEGMKLNFNSKNFHQ